MQDVESILRTAIALAKRSESLSVEPDHVLTASLLSLAKFGIARMGDLLIDLEALGIDWIEDRASDSPSVPKVAYSSATAALLEKSAAIRAAERSSDLNIFHLLAAFATPEPQGLMARLAHLGIDSAAWRAAIADLDTARQRTTPATPTSGSYVSPEQAAEILGVHHQTIRGYIRSGKLPALKIAGERAVRIRREDLDRLLEPVTSSDSA